MPLIRRPADPNQALKERAARWLITPSALVELSLDDALQVVDYMRPRQLAAGTVVLREGDTATSDHMLLVLEGELSVEKRSQQSVDGDMVVRVMGPGSLIGELGLLDGAPRSASCVAQTDLSVAVMTRQQLLRLLQEQPRVGAKLVLAISKRMADHLREMTRKLELLSKMNRALGEELTALPGEAAWNEWGRPGQ